MAGPYVCTLDAASLKKAKDELNEDPADRMAKVEAFRELIRTRAPHIVCSMEADFLLKFLRVGKFSQLEALKRLETFLRQFDKIPQWTRDIDMSDKDIQKFLDTGYAVPLGYNDEGHFTILYNFGCFDPKKKDSKRLLFRSLMGMFLHFSMDERTVVNGINGTADFSTFGFKHQMFWGVEDLKVWANIFNGCWPMRWKAFNFYNHGQFFLGAYNLFSPFVKKKMKERFNFCGSNLEVVYGTHVPMRLLPEEYLPDDYTGPTNGTLQELVNKLKNEMKKPDVVAKIKYASSTAFRLDESKRPKDDVPLATFRKLNVD